VAKQKEKGKRAKRKRQNGKGQIIINLDNHKNQCSIISQKAKIQKEICVNLLYLWAKRQNANGKRQKYIKQSV
jgi:hypothetical protein